VPRVALGETQRRNSALDIGSYDVALDLAQGPDTFWSRSQVRFLCKRDDVVAFADLQAVSIQQMALNGRPLDVGRVHDGRVDLRPHSRAELRETDDTECARDGAGVR
jgi:aminopeptidase N